MQMTEWAFDLAEMGLGSSLVCSQDPHKTPLENTKHLPTKHVHLALSNPHHQHPCTGQPWLAQVIIMWGVWHWCWCRTATGGTRVLKHICDTPRTVQMTCAGPNEFGQLGLHCTFSKPQPSVCVKQCSKWGCAPNLATALTGGLQIAQI